MKAEVSITLSAVEFEDLVEIYIDSLVDSVLYLEDEERSLVKSIVYRLKVAAEHAELTQIAERLARKWTDVDSPAGEYSSSSSPAGMAA